jgi:TRAP transporter TAXI family solute receptor
MRRTIRETVLTVRDLLVTALPFILLSVALLAGAYYLLKPTPPKKVVLATGGEQGAYAAFGKRYQEELKRFGVQVELRHTAGSRENLRLLRDGSKDVDIAFVQGGASESSRARLEEEKEDDSLPLMSLGSMFYEPVWIFYRAAAARKSRDGVVHEFADFKGMKVNTGPRGSGIPGISNRLLQANLMERDDLVRTSLETTPAVMALLNGSIDAMVLVSAPEAPMVQMLLQTPGIRLFEFAQAEAYARRYRFLSTVSLARGVVDLSRNVPPRDVPMVAATCSLVAREDLHPALVQLFVQAATRIHGGGGWISKAGQFPTSQNTEFPLARDAERYYRTGPPLLQRYLPFWLANFTERMWVALLSIMVVLIPLARVLPPLYTFRIRSRVFRWYRDLRQIEEEVVRGGASNDALLERLDKLDDKVARVALPLAYTDELYALRSAIRLVRNRLRGISTTAMP